MTMLAEHRPKDPAKFFDGGQKIHLKIYSPPRSFKFFTAIEKSSCRFFKMQELTGPQKSASPKNWLEKGFMAMCNCSKGTSSSPNSKYFAKKEMFTILELSFLSNNTYLYLLRVNKGHETWMLPSSIYTFDFNQWSLALVRRRGLQLYRYFYYNFVYTLKGNLQSRLFSVQFYYRMI